MRRPSDLLSLLAVTALVAVAAVGHASLPIDVENAAMKSVGTPHAEVAARAVAEFGVDHTVFLLLEPRAPGVRVPRFADDARCFATRLRARPEVATLRAVPLRDPSARLFAVEVGVGDDGRYAAPVRALVDDARRTAPPTHRVRASGFPVGEIAIAEALAVEQGRMVPVIAATLLVLLLACYRSLALAAAAVLPAFAGILLLGGIQKLAGLALDPISSLLAPVLLTVGVAGAVHLIEKFLAHRAAGDGVEAAVGLAVADLRVPAALAVATTVAGFVGLLANPIPAVGRFGVLAAVGVGLSCAAAFVIVPPWLRMFVRSERVVAVAASRGSWTILGPGIVAWLRARARRVVIAGAALVAVFAWGCGGLRVDTDPLRVLPATHPFRTATAAIAERVGGVDTIDLLLEAPLPAFAAARVAALQVGLAGVPGIAGPAGAARRGDRGSYLVPLLLRPEGTTGREATVAAAEEVAREVGFARAVATGPAVLVTRDSGALVRGQLAGLIFTVAFLWLAMAVGFRSVRLATLGLIPNLLPCVLLYGSLGFVGRPLSVGSAMIGSVMLGVVVDDTIHLLHGYGRARRRGSGVEVALARALRRSGRALVVTSLVLTCGFAVGVLGDLETTREFGVLAAGTIVTALLADLVLLPAVLLLRSRASSGTTA